MTHEANVVPISLENFLLSSLTQPFWDLKRGFVKRLRSRSGSTKARAQLLTCEVIAKPH